MTARKVVSIYFGASGKRTDFDGSAIASVINLFKKQCIASLFVSKCEFHARVSCF